MIGVRTTEGNAPPEISISIRKMDKRCVVSNQKICQLGLLNIVADRVSSATHFGYGYIERIFIIVPDKIAAVATEDAYCRFNLGCNIDALKRFIRVIYINPSHVIKTRIIGS